MALGVQHLQTVARRATAIALNIYDQGTPALNLFARVLRIPGQRTVTMEWWEAFPQMVEWIGDREDNVRREEALNACLKSKFSVGTKNSYSQQP